MTTIQISPSEYCGFQYKVVDSTEQWWFVLDLTWAGYFQTKDYRKVVYKFPLTSLPSGATVTQVRLRVSCIDYPGGAAGVWLIKPFGGNGQPDPHVCDPPPCMAGAKEAYQGIDSEPTIYVSTTAFRVVGEYWFDLGSLACTHVQNAKSAVNRFSVSINEDGMNDQAPWLPVALLEITYEVPPTAGYAYSNGFVTIQVIG